MASKSSFPSSSSAVTLRNSIGCIQPNDACSTAIFPLKSFNAKSIAVCCKPIQPSRLGKIKMMAMKNRKNHFTLRLRGVGFPVWFQRHLQFDQFETLGFLAVICARSLRGRKCRERLDLQVSKILCFARNISKMNLALGSRPLAQKTSRWVYAE